MQIEECDLRPADDHGYTIEKDGRVETSWLLPDRQHAINLVERDGAVFAWLEDFSQESNE